MLKSALREDYLQQRQALSEKAIEERSLQISRLFFQKFKLEGIKYLHCFLPIKKKKEINTWLLIRRIWKEYPQTGLVVSRTDWANRRMEHFHLQEETPLAESKLGIPEPLGAPSCPAIQIDLVLLPLLAFDRRGQRAGYGAGFYDRFLSECAPQTKKVGLSLFSPTEELISDINEHDIPLDACITPEKIYYF
jgi:5-formyltetrahydrofolate cyclo-ligase